MLSISNPKDAKSSSENSLGLPKLTNSRDKTGSHKTQHHNLNARDSSHNTDNSLDGKMEKSSILQISQQKIFGLLTCLLVTTQNAFGPLSQRFDSQAVSQTPRLPQHTPAMDFFSVGKQFYQHSSPESSIGSI